MARIEMFADGMTAPGAVAGLCALGSVVSHAAAGGIVAVGLPVGGIRRSRRGRRRGNGRPRPRPGSRLRLAAMQVGAQLRGPPGGAFVAVAHATIVVSVMRSA